MTSNDWLPWIPFPNRIMAPMGYFGGKGYMHRHIIPIFPTDAELYVEPFFGAGSVFWNLPKPYPAEVINDIDGDIVAVFRCLQDDELFEQLAQRLVWTPYARAELGRALEIEPETEVDRAWRTLILHNFGTSGARAKTLGSWGRAMTATGDEGALTVASWRKRLKLLEYWHDRLTRVQIDNRPALEVIKYWDRETALLYLDPPYVQESRRSGDYSFEMCDDDHLELIRTIRECKGRVVLSGYPSELYDSELRDWNRAEFKVTAGSAARVRGSGLQGRGAVKAKQQRVEVVWWNFDSVAKVQTKLIE